MREARLVENQIRQHLIILDRYTFIFFFLQQIFIEYLLGANCHSNPEDTVINRADKILRKVNSFPQSKRDLSSVSSNINYGTAPC